MNLLILKDEKKHSLHIRCTVPILDFVAALYFFQVIYVLLPQKIGRPVIGVHIRILIGHRLAICGWYMLRLKEWKGRVDEPHKCWGPYLPLLTGDRRYRPL